MLILFGNSLLTGGDEVLFSEAGKDATDAFEDVGHSDEAREIMSKFLVGTADVRFYTYQDYYTAGRS